MKEDRGIGCKDCLVTKGVVSYDECIGCNGQVNCNATYFPPKPKVEINKPKINIFKKLFGKKESKMYWLT
jgi:hypothetical protein